MTRTNKKKEDVQIHTDGGYLPGNTSIIVQGQVDEVIEEVVLKYVHDIRLHDVIQLLGGYLGNI